MARRAELYWVKYELGGKKQAKHYKGNSPEQAAAHAPGKILSVRKVQPFTGSDRWDDLLAELKAQPRTILPNQSKTLDEMVFGTVKPLVTDEEANLTEIVFGKPKAKHDKDGWH
jgi:hypothetical protein